MTSREKLRIVKQYAYIKQIFFLIGDQDLVNRRLKQQHFCSIVVVSFFGRGNRSTADTTDHAQKTYKQYHMTLYRVNLVMLVVMVTELTNNIT